jgi:outer membrane protein OmpA-like peptidoglycan-associated protein/LysM repeat protein
MKKVLTKQNGLLLLALLFIFSGLCNSASAVPCCKEDKRKTEIDELQKKFSWWPTDAKPSPVKDEARGGYWWWPNEPGKVGPLWGNRGYIYVYKIIFDYKEEELPPAKPQELRPSLVIKKIIKNVKIYFDYNKSLIREDAAKILDNAVGSLKRNPQADILITGNCDRRGSEKYNEKLGRKRGEEVKQYMLDKGIPESRIRIISRGKLDAVAFVTDLVGMQKDRNAQFMVAEVEEVMIPAPGASSQSAASEPAIATETKPSETTEGAVTEEVKENVESTVKVSTKEYTIKKNDSLWSIASKELGSGHRWKYLYELNKDRIKNPNKLKTGTKITIPVE